METPPNPARPQVVRSLICQAHVEMALSCLGTLLTRSLDPLRIALYDDGTVTDEQKFRLSAGLNRAEIVDGRQSDTRAMDLLRGRPACQSFRSANVMGRKLFDIVLFHDEEEIIYSDTDILFCRDFRGLFSWPDVQTGAIFMRDRQESYSLRPWDLLGTGIRAGSRLNAGLMFIRRSIFDLDYLEWFLGRNLTAFARIPFWVEQTAWATLASRCQARIWDPAQVLVVTGERDLTPRVVAAHFTSEVRHLLAEALERMPVPGLTDVKSVPSRSLGAFGLARSQVARYVRTRFAGVFKDEL